MLDKVFEMVSKETPTQPHIPTRFMVFSDTHDMNHVLQLFSGVYADVVLHCGDFTNDSKLSEFKSAIKALQAMNAPFKLMIAENHDFTMDLPAFHHKIKSANPSFDPRHIESTYGTNGEARRLFSPETGITFLEEGTHTFRLSNGALLRVYASPYTPSAGGERGFQYKPDLGHNFSIHNVDVVMTHGPPQGILDSCCAAKHAGCPWLFEAVARARLLMHCFGHIHESWGGRFVIWYPKISTKPSQLTDIDKEHSHLIERLSTLKGRLPWPALAATNHSSTNPQPMKRLKRGAQTLFINAAIKGRSDRPIQPPWLVDLDLLPAPWGLYCDSYGRIYSNQAKEVKCC